MQQSPLATLLVPPTLPIPLYLRRFEVELTFTSAYTGKEDRRVINGAFKELDKLLKAGFFSWEKISASAASRVMIKWRDQGFAVVCEGAGLHHNVLVATFRMMISLHHTPRESFEEALALLGDDADALPPRAEWAGLIESIRLGNVEGADERISGRTQFDSFILDTEIPRPRGGMLDDASAPWDKSRIIVQGVDPVVALDKRSLRSLENKFLAVCGSGAFRNWSQLDQLPDEGEFFLRAADGRSELIIDGYSDDTYGLLEFLNAMTGGKIKSLQAKPEDI